MSSEVLDAFEDLSGWTTVASGQAHLDLPRAAGIEGHALQLDFDFKGGGGFIVARKPFSLVLPDAYIVSVKGLHTHYGTLNCTLRREGMNALRLPLTVHLTMPSGAIIAKPPLPGPVVPVEINGRGTSTLDAEHVRIGQCPAEVVVHIS